MDSQQPQRLDSVIGGDLWQFIIGNKWQATNSRPWPSNKYINSAAPREAQIERCSLLVSAPCSCRRGTGPATYQEKSCQECHPGDRPGVRPDHAR